MSLPNYLNKIKSAGIYRFVFDKSEVPGDQAETMRLVVGYSEKGPFNTLVYIESISEFETIFGGINKKLERRGCFFHRLAEQALTTGPILVINLKPFNTDASNPEEVDATSFNVTETAMRGLGKLGIEDIYDTTRFWHLEPEGLCKRFAAKHLTQDSPGKYITITATDSANTTGTIFFRGYQPKGYDISFKEWYSSVLNGEELPSYLEGHDMDKVSEYFAEVYIFRGVFTPEIATSEALAKYFNVTGDKVTLKPFIENAFGEKRDTLAALAADSNSGFVNSYSGILLPNFQSPSGGYISLNLMFNAGQDDHKMMMDFNIDALYDGEISIDELNTTGWQQVGKALEGGATLGSISLQAMSLNGVTPKYSNATFNSENQEWDYVTPAGATETYADMDFYAFDMDAVSIDGYTLTGGTELEQIASVGDKFIIKTTDRSDSDVAVVTKIETVEDGGGEPEEVQLTLGMPADGSIIDVTRFGSPDDSDNNILFRNYATVMESFYIQLDCGNIASEGSVTAFDFTVKLTESIGSTSEEEFFGAQGDKYPYVGIVAPNGKVFIGKPMPLDFDPEDPRWDTARVQMKFENQDGFAGGMYSVILMNEKDCGEITFDEIRVEGMVRAGVLFTNGRTSSNNLTDVASEITFRVDKTATVSNGIRLTFDREISGLYVNQLIRCNHPVYASCQNITPVALYGYTYGLALPGSQMIEKLNWQTEVLNTLTKYEGIRLALTNRKDSEYHYLVDTFESYVASELKSTFGVIAKEKDNCLALVNFPAISTFKNCPYSSYTDKNGKFQTKYIADGYNKQKPAAVYFSLMSEFNGASFVSYNTPVVLSDGTIKTNCPSAALVSNDFMAKYDTRFPYSIVAGPTYGRITFPGLVGPDFNFSRADLDILEPMGVNCMVYVPRKGTYINSNQTAKQNPVTALSKINVRELVIYLQDEIENLLQSYQWEFNTQELRDTIKSKADTICETVKLNGGLYEYLNVCDDSNNTPEVIDNEMIILDTSIEPGRGAGKMVQRLYIYKTGGLKAIMS